jgi:Zn-finger nucleic acid-binding protein
MKAQTAKEKAAAMKCPKCEGTLIETDFQNIKINVCSQCSGVWLDAGEFGHIAQDESDGGWFGKVFG